VSLREEIVLAIGDDAVGVGDGGAILARPADADAASRVVAACTAAGVRVATAGVGAADVLLDLSRLDDIRIDLESHLVHAGAGVDVAAIEAALSTEGLTLGWALALDAPVGGFLAAGEPGPGGASAFPGWSPVMALEAVLLDGTKMHTTLAPRSATGPDLKVLLVGGKDRVGVITGVTLRVHAAAQLSRRVVYAFPDFGSSVDAVVETLGRDLFPERFGIVDGGAGESVLTWESQGEARRVALVVQSVEDACGGAGGRRLSAEARKDASGLHAGGTGAAGPEEIRASIGEASGVEVVVRWSRLTVMRRAVLEAAGEGARVHVSRALPEGALTLVCAPDQAGAAMREAVRRAGGFVPGEDDEGGWYQAVGAVLDGGKDGGE